MVHLWLDRIETHVASFLKVDSKYRTDVVLLTNCGWVIGYVLLPLAAYWTLSYIRLQLIPTFIIMVMAVLWLPILQESPRWLLSTGRWKRARKVIVQAATWNGIRDSRSEESKSNFDEQFNQLVESYEVKERASPINVDPIEEYVPVCKDSKDKTQTWRSFLPCFKKKSDEKPKNVESLEAAQTNITFYQLLVNPRLVHYRKILLLLWFTFFTNGLIYYGFSLNIELIHGSMYTNFALAGLMELPSMIINLVGMKLMGRRTFTVATLIAGGLCFGLGSLSEQAKGWNTSWDKEYIDSMVVAWSLLGKMFIFSTYNAIYIHSGELLPTGCRQMGISSCSIAARVGSTVAPFVKEFVSLKRIRETKSKFLISFCRQISSAWSQRWPRSAHWRWSPPSHH